MYGLGTRHTFQCKKFPKLQAPYLYRFTTNPHESSQFSKVDVINRPKVVFQKDNCNNETGYRGNSVTLPCSLRRLGTKKRLLLSQDISQRHEMGRFYLLEVRHHKKTAKQRNNFLISEFNWRQYSINSISSICVKRQPSNRILYTVSLKQGNPRKLETSASRKMQTRQQSHASRGKRLTSSNQKVMIESVKDGGFCYREEFQQDPVALGFLSSEPMKFRQFN